MMTELVTARASHGEKAETVGAVYDRLRAAKMAIVTEYRGLTVAQMTRLRREIRQASGEYQVIKNTLVRRALKDTAYGDLERLLQGPNGWVFAYDDPVMLTKALVKFANDNDKLAIKGGVFEGQFMDSAKVKILAQMPSKPELQAKLLAMINAPATQLVRLIQEPGARVVRLLETLRKGKSE
ncbi:MAG: 50S ribosomal protein L10 [Deltaproteobacteria bacterium]|nr:50S ribosomal protein L10 [Deltaproteobacteria bacterium]MDZ4342354.1 50S ribosomal protein L10 [Candidatus Binatia bacterium]